MERLTRRSKINGSFVFFSKHIDAVCKTPQDFCGRPCANTKDRTCPYLMVIDRLAAYEDSGLTPEEVRAMAANLKQGVTANE